MEKLQKALEKARSRRMAGRDLPEHMRSTSVSPELLDREHSDSWATLPEMQIDPAHLRRFNVITLEGGSESTYYDILRTRLRDEAKRRGFKRIAVTSAQPQVGKTTTLTNLGFSFGRLPYHRTLVFDFDLRRPTMHKLLGQNPAADMGKVLSGEIAFENHILRHGDNLAFGLNSGAVANPSELLQSDRTQDFLSAVDEAFFPDLMLFDMPPFLASDDAHGFLKNIDGVLLIVEAEHTTKNQLDSVEQRLSELTNVIGVVLNKCNFPDENDVGSYGYNYY